VDDQERQKVINIGNWSELSVNGRKLLITPMRPETKKYGDCTTDGTPLTKKQVQKAIYKSETPDGKEYTGDKLKLVDGKPKKKLTKTKNVKTVATMPLKEVHEYDGEFFYVKADEALLKELKQKEIAWSFAFSNGGGFKVYKGILYPFSDKTLVLKICQVNVKKKVDEIEEGLNAGKDLEDLQAELEQENKASEDELLAQLDI
jgi:hypothetical protein